MKKDTHTLPCSICGKEFKESELHEFQIPGVLVVLYACHTCRDKKQKPSEKPANTKNTGQLFS
ncbi:MAG TPA: hypothetical protein VNZ45_07345 [Bacteroidia bacterium]|nr:hypothetical protein [Bacteroidia bacterium]